jgi:hypothetical protein
MEDHGAGRPIYPSKIARLLMVDDSEVNKTVSKFKSELHDLVRPNSDANKSTIKQEKPKNE